MIMWLLLFLSILFLLWGLFSCLLFLLSLISLFNSCCCPVVSVSNAAALMVIVLVGLEVLSELHKEKKNICVRLSVGDSVTPRDDVKQR